MDLPWQKLTQIEKIQQSKEKSAAFIGAYIY
jgi:hypothetical protein